MSWIKAKYVIPLLELTLIGGGVCLVYTGGIYKFEPGKTGSFFIADKFFDCNQAILSLGGEGCSRPAHLAVLTLNNIR
jgi:hypothetical protein